MLQRTLARTASGRGLLRPAAARLLSDKPKPPPPDPAAVEAAKRHVAEKQKAHVAAQGRTVTPWFLRDEPDHPWEFPEDPSEVALLTGQPEDQRNRTVLITKNPRTPWQQGPQLKSRHWGIQWKQQERWTNPLMGWTSSADPLGKAELRFEDIDQAIRFCQKMGWKYEVEQPPHDGKVERMGKINYSHNFLPRHVLAELKKNKTRTKEFVHPAANDSHYFRPLNYHGTAEVDQHGPPSGSK